MKKLQVIATTQTSMMQSANHEVGNVNTSLDYITGTSLRGACAARLLENGHPVDDSFYQLFCSEDVRFENLYPACAQIKQRIRYFPSQPIPLSVRTCKGFPGFFDKYDAEPHGTTDTLFRNHKEKCPACDAVLNDFPGFYYRERTDRDWHELRKVTAQSLITMHNEIEDVSQLSKEGILFTFDGKDRRQVFIGSIYFVNEKSDDILANFKKRLLIDNETLILSVGKRRTARGTIRLQFSEFPNQAFPDPQFIYRDFDQRFDGQTNEFTITLFSDAIVMDRWLRYRTALTAEVLAEELELENALDLELIEPFFCSSRTISGWNDAHKLPKVDEIAIEKGSSFRYRFNGDIAVIKEKLRNLEQEGLGFRRNEGFGRVIINHPFHKEGIDIWRF